MARNIVTGIDVGTNTTRVVVAEQLKGRTFPRICGTSAVESKGLRRGYIINHADAVKTIRQAIAQAEKAADVRIKKATISVGGVSLESTTSKGEVVVSRADGEVTSLDIENALQASEEQLGNLANKKIIQTVPIEYTLDGETVLGHPEGMKGTRLGVKVLFITCLEQHFEDLIGAIEDAGVEVEQVIPSPIAASVVALTKKQRMVGSLLANIGAETVSMVVYEDDMPVSLQVLPIGSTDITNDIALGFRIPLEEAEQLKTGEKRHTYPKKKLDEIIEARLSDIFEFIEAHLKKIQRSGLLPAGIIITGGGAGISTIEDLAKATLRLPSTIPELRAARNGTGDGSEHAKKPSPEQKYMRDSSWYVAYGLCLCAANSHGGVGTRTTRSSGGTNIFAKLGNWLKQLLP